MTSAELKEIKAILCANRNEMKGDNSPYARGWRKALECAQDDIIAFAKKEPVS